MLALVGALLVLFVTNAHALIEQSTIAELLPNHEYVQFGSSLPSHFNKRHIEGIAPLHLSLFGYNLTLMLTVNDDLFEKNKLGYTFTSVDHSRFLRGHVLGHHHNSWVRMYIYDKGIDGVIVLNSNSNSPVSFRLDTVVNKHGKLLNNVVAYRENELNSRVRNQKSHHHRDNNSIDSNIPQPSTKIHNSLHLIQQISSVHLQKPRTWSTSNRRSGSAIKKRQTNTCEQHKESENPNSEVYSYRENKYTGEGIDESTNEDDWVDSQSDNVEESTTVTTEPFTTTIIDTATETPVVPVAKVATVARVATVAETSVPDDVRIAILGISYDDSLVTYKNNVAIETWIAQRLQVVSATYERTLKVRFQIRKIIKNNRMVSDNGDAIFANMKTEIDGNQLGYDKTDVALHHFMTARGPYKIHSGQSRVGALCTEDSVGWTSPRWADLDTEGLLAHEFGHTFGAMHDSGVCDVDGNIMTLFVSRTWPLGSKRWSSCSLASIQPVLEKATCVAPA